MVASWASGPTGGPWVTRGGGVLRSPRWPLGAPWWFYVTSTSLGFLDSSSWWPSWPSRWPSWPLGPPWWPRGPWVPRFIPVSPRGVPVVSPRPSGPPWCPHAPPPPLGVPLVSPRPSGPPQRHRGVPGPPVVSPPARGPRVPPVPPQRPQGATTSHVSPFWGHHVPFWGHHVPLGGHHVPLVASSHSWPPWRPQVHPGVLPPPHGVPPLPRGVPTFSPTATVSLTRPPCPPPQVTTWDEYREEGTFPGKI